jgi:hypothetical protein
MKQVGTGLNYYAADFDNRLPAVDWQDAVLPYVNKPDLFTDPYRQREGGENGLAFNKPLLGASLSSIPSPESAAMMYLTRQTGTNAVGDGTDVRFVPDSTVIGFADISVRRILRANFDPEVFTFHLQEAPRD